LAKNITVRQRLLAHAYAADPQHNGTKAALSVGCPQKSAHVTASRWLKDTEVQNLVDQFLGRLVKKYELSAEKVVEDLCQLAFANMLDYVRTDREGSPCLSLSEITRDQAAAIEEIRSENGVPGKSKRTTGRSRVSIKLSDKVASLEFARRISEFVREGSRTS
jgi:phage terminase small subunit